MKNFVYPILIITLLLFILIINLLKPRKAIENFNATGPCEKNGKTGTCYIMSDGSQECVVADDVTPQQGITIQPKEKKKPPVKKSPPTCNQIRNYQKTATLVASDCIIQSTGETGIIFPRLGNRCVSRALVEKCKKRTKTTPASVTRRSTKAGSEPPVGKKIAKKTKPVKCVQNVMIQKIYNFSKMNVIRLVQIGDYGNFRIAIVQRVKNRVSVVKVIIMGHS
jgi:hypothetical protein